jgi:threonine aldolase
MIDLRSDTITRPTEAMLAAMQEATYGDDSRDGDPTVQKLEALAAAKTGKEAGAYMPSGTMTNLGRDARARATRRRGAARRRLAHAELGIGRDGSARPVFFTAPYPARAAAWT